jgi:putative toxin-antitoxin system antitoxin component (TIGR02293 family)
MLDDRVPLDIIDRDEGLQQTENLLEKMAEIVDRAIAVFNNESVAKNWLRTPNPYLGDLIPLNMLESAEGIEHILDMLGRIDYGVYS